MSCWYCGPRWRCISWRTNRLASTWPWNMVTSRKPWRQHRSWMTVAVGIDWAWKHWGNLGLFKVIVYFPNGKSTIWGIYSEYFLFFGHPLSKSKARESTNCGDGLSEDQKLWLLVLPLPYHWQREQVEKDVEDCWDAWWCHVKIPQRPDVGSCGREGEDHGWDGAGTFGPYKENIKFEIFWDQSHCSVNAGFILVQWLKIRRRTIYIYIYTYIHNYII